MNVKESIKNYVISELISDNQHSTLSDTDQLIESGIIDSLGIMKLIGFLEENLSVQIDDMELVPENFATIESIATMVEKKL
ncbi:MAG: acyl carrier protein [Cyclobacteriaceae bacterium]|nr:MAG: acyl carrier protein [Cyclobacteriaceae bacterium]